MYGNKLTDRKDNMVLAWATIASAHQSYHQSMKLSALRQHHPAAFASWRAGKLASHLACCHDTCIMLLQLEKAGHRCTSIRGDLDHQLRDRVVNEFRTGITKILIATDVLSRGFDVTQVCASPIPIPQDLY